MFLLIFLLEIVLIIMSSAKVSILIKVNVGKQSSAKPCRHQGSSLRQEEVGKGLEDLEAEKGASEERGGVSGVATFLVVDRTA